VKTYPIPEPLGGEKNTPLLPPGAGGTLAKFEVFGGSWGERFLADFEMLPPGVGGSFQVLGGSLEVLGGESARRRRKFFRGFLAVSKGKTLILGLGRRRRPENFGVCSPPLPPTLGGSPPHFRVFGGEWGGVFSERF